MEIKNKIVEEIDLESNHNLPKQAVIVEFYYGMDELDTLHELAFELIRITEEEGVGIYDGQETNMDGTDGTLFMYGENAEVLFKTVKPELERTDFLNGATAHLFFGSFLEEGVKSIEVKIGE